MNICCAAEGSHGNLARRCVTLRIPLISSNNKRSRCRHAQQNGRQEEVDEILFLVATVKTIVEDLFLDYG